MAKPKVFVSSAYVDLREVRSAVGDFFQEIGFEAKLFERGGVFYDLNIALDRSCIKEVEESDLLILVIGGRYGSQVSSHSGSSGSYNSVTKEEYLAARNAEIPVYTFVKQQVLTEFETYRKNLPDIRDTITYANTDNVQIFRLIEEIYELKKGNPIFPYSLSTDIIRDLKAQLAGMWSAYLKGQRANRLSIDKIRINAYKLFFYRFEANLSFGDLSKKTGLDRNLLRRLEKVDRKYEHLEPKMFSSCDKNVIEKIEDVLNCNNQLRVGRNDDFLSVYIQYYEVYKGKRKLEIRVPDFEISLFPTKAVVFDFDGTLTNRKQDLTTWEEIWVSLGYSIDDCSRYLNQFIKKRITHAEWCNITCEKFSEKGFQESQLHSIASKTELISGTREVLMLLHSYNIKLYILSGSIRQIIKQVLGDTYELFDDIRANDMIFDKSGKLIRINGTKYDFEGKADFLKEILRENGFSPLEVLFIGNSLNDVWASQSGVKTLCVNPRHTNPHDAKHWSYYLRKVTDLKDILKFLGLTLST